MTVLSGIHDMAYLFQRAGGAGGSAYAGDWVGFAANLGAAAGKAMWYGRNQITVLKDALAKSGTKVLPTPTAIIDVAMVAISAIDLLNGFSAPDGGGSFKTGADGFASAVKSLSLAVPDARDWDGDASKAYADANAALQQLMQTMQELDEQMQTLVHQQGSEVQSAHTTIAITLFGLVIAQGVALAMYLIPVVGPEVSCIWQIATVFAAGAVVFGKEMFTLAESMSAANKANVVASQYAEVAGKAKLPGSFATIEIAEAKQTTVGDFKAISDGLSTFAAPPTVASLARMATAGATAEQRTLLDALAGEQTADAAAGTDRAGTTPQTPIADSSRFSTPTMTDLTALTGQVAKVSANVAQPLNVVNQTMGTVQQIVATAQQGQDAAPPSAAPAEPSPFYGESTGDEHAGSDGEDSGAAAGAEAGERAPVDATSGEDSERREPGAAWRPL